MERTFQCTKIQKLVVFLSLAITEYAKHLFPEVWLCNCLNINTLQHQKVYCETGFSEDEEEEGVA